MGPLKDGLFYINIHSTAFPGGEIRGQVLPIED
ncbi:MAG: CHRD domain-containing protein [Thaumarchaeota archaeon]|nr:CHRD domain-containing protein [Nitrososphaerota archaeon]